MNAIRSVLVSVGVAAAAAGCTSWQRVGTQAGATPEGALLQLFNPAELYRSLDRMVSTSGVPFIATSAVLPGPAAGQRVVVGVSLTNRALSFTRADDHFLARYRVEYTLSRSGAEPITASREAVVRVPTMQETLRTDETLLLQHELHAPAGDYLLTVRLADRTSNEVGIATDSITVPPFGPGSFTQPMLVYEVRGRAERGDSVGIILNPRGSIAFGGDTLLIYLEGVGYSTPTRVPLQVLDASDSVVFRTAVEFTAQREIESQIIRLTPDSAPLGPLRVVIGEGSSARQVAGVVSFSGNWLITNFDDLLSLLRYFGEDNRIGKMRDATPESRPELWREFFASTDPNKLTPENEALDAYFARLSVANDLFRDEGIAGWRTDRGEVYVSLGPPDEVYDATPMQSGRFIRWAYYDYRISLIFQDQSGFGRYRLGGESRSEFERVKARVQRSR
ncbi:MAG TPA: GWxTD domain-containing protein [Gemmatimonadales bacterium]|nr:GWxTD domain-containing protein [Gemmatimonadales bacterium]